MTDERSDRGTTLPVGSERNGAPPAGDVFPVDSFREAAPHLRRPFTVQAVKFKPQSVTKGGKTLCVAYIDARLVVERLNLVCPHLWHDAYRPVGPGTMWCDLTVDGTTRSDVGEGTKKGLVSDALKRAAVKFGVGVSLYAIPTMFLAGEVRYLSEGSAELRDLKGRYRLWLEGVGVKAFGQPLDHGDADGAQGDHEVEREATPPTSAPSPNSTLGDTHAAELILNADTAGLTREQLRKAIGHAQGADPGSLEEDAMALTIISRLPAEHGARVSKWVEKKRPPVRA